MQVQSMLNPFSQGQPAEDMTTRLSHQQSSLHAEVNRVEQNAEMTLYTEEGDKVTLSMNNTLQTAFASYTESGGMVGGGIMQANRSALQVSETEFQQELGMTVEGDLNEQEQKDIKKAIKAMGRMMKDFMSGDTAKMANRAFKVKGLESVAGLEVSLEYEKSNVTVDRTQQTTEGLLSVSNPTALTGDDDLEDEVEDLVERMMEPVREQDMDLGHLAKATEQMFDEIESNDPAAAFEAGDFKELVQMIRSRFSDQLNAVLNENRPDASGAGPSGQFEESD